MTKYRWPAALLTMLLAFGLILTPVSRAEDVVPSPTSALSSAPVRVALAWSKSSLTAVTTTVGMTVTNGASGGTIATGATNLSFSASPAGITVEGYGTFTGPVNIVPDTTADGSLNLLAYANKHYRGTFSVALDDQGLLMLVNTVPLEEYLFGVVPREMPASWPAEALKAQAVAARTYAVYRLPTSSSQPFDVYCNIGSQVYGGYDGEDPRSSAAVQETAGIVATYNGQPIDAFFFSSSGGYTENSEYVYSSALPYLRGVPDYDQDSPNNQWSVEYSLSELQDLLKSYSVGQLYEIVPGTPGVSGRWSQVTLRGSSGERTISANTFRNAVGSTRLKSTWFTLVRNNDRMADVTQSQGYAAELSVVGAGGRTATRIPAGATVITASGTKTVSAGDYAAPSTVEVIGKRFVPASLTFNGRGYGHGTGMSQWGARGMALQGHNYQAILTHYYTGIQLEQR